MTELLMLIALWCGQPINKTITGDAMRLLNGSVRATTEGSEVTPAQVKACRQRILMCQGNYIKPKKDCFEQ